MSPTTNTSPSQNASGVPVTLESPGLHGEPPPYPRDTLPCWEILGFTVTGCCLVGLWVARACMCYICTPGRYAPSWQCVQPRVP